MQPSRICPQCRQRTDERICPDDGFQTVDGAHYTDIDGEDPYIGTVFEERYRIEQLLGRGGMGAVYSATQLAVDRQVALKILRRELANNLKAVARFQQEARAVAGLNHPNIIQLYDYGQAEDKSLFLVTELLIGQPLTDLMETESPVSADRVLAMATQILDALVVAHGQDIVHRDLKPDNLFVTEVGRKRDFIKILDFGIAKVSGEAASSMTLTGTGMAVGTPRYIAPEQARALPVSPKTDLYALGVIMYEMLTGQPIFEARSPTDFMVAHVHAIPEPPTIGGQLLSGPLIDIIMACLEKEPEDRPESAEVVLDRLEACAREPLHDTSALALDATAAQTPATAIEPDPGVYTSKTIRMSSDVALAAAKAAEEARRLESLETGHARSPVAGPSSDAHLRTAVVDADDDDIALVPSFGRRFALPLAVAALMALGVGAWFMFGPPSQKTSPAAGVASGPSVQASTRPAEPAEPAEVSPTPKERPGAAAGTETDTPPAAAKAPMTVTLTTTPPGATVLRDGEPVGETPHELSWAEGEAPPEVELRRGTAVATFQVVAAHAGTSQEVTLVAPSTPTKPSTTAGKKKATPPKKKGTTAKAPTGKKSAAGDDKKKKRSTIVIPPPPQVKPPATGKSKTSPKAKVKTKTKKTSGPPPIPKGSKKGDDKKKSQFKMLD